VIIKSINKVNLKIVATEKGKYFIREAKIDILTDEDEWKWSQRGDPVLHIQLRDWADIFLIAPLSANSLAKISNGLCDNLVTCICRAWDFEKTIIG